MSFNYRFGPGVPSVFILPALLSNKLALLQKPEEETGQPEPEQIQENTRAPACSTVFNKNFTLIYCGYSSYKSHGMNCCGAMFQTFNDIKKDNFTFKASVQYSSFWENFVTQRQ